MIQGALTEPQLELLRAATPGWHDSLHLNHAGASPMSMASLAAIREHMELESRLGAMDAAQIVAAKIAQVRSDAARLFNADTDEVALLASGSAAFGAVWAALPPLRAGDRILVGRQEWGGNLVSYLRSAARAGARVEMLPCLPDGRVDVEAATAMLDERVRWLSLTWLPANGGLINDAAALGSLARAAGVPYFIDAGQAVGQLPVDVSVLGCDVLKSAARKHLRGPRGTALLYVRKSFVGRLEPSWVDVQSAPWFDELRPDARRFETAEQSVALWLGLQPALNLALELGVDAIAKRVQGLAKSLREQLASVPGVTVRDESTGARSGLVSFTVEDRLAPDVKAALAREGVRVGANGVPYTPWDMQVRGLTGIVRASVSYLNSEADLGRLVEALGKLR
jgi:selenocysteine lyase/cysteine desulfurase